MRYLLIAILLLSLRTHAFASISHFQNHSSCATIQSKVRVFSIKLDCKGCKKKMSLNVKQFKELVLVPVLRYLEPEIPYSEEAVTLMLGTAAQESRFHYIDQTTPGPGPAYGLFQVERTTEQWLWDSYINKTPSLKAKVESLLADWPNDRMTQMHCNLAYSVAIARIRYRVVKAPIPTTLDGIAKYYKKYYNTYKGKATPAEFLSNYKRYVSSSLG